MISLLDGLRYCSFEAFSELCFFIFSFCFVFGVCFLWIFFVCFHYINEKLVSCYKKKVNFLKLFLIFVQKIVFKNHHAKQAFLFFLVKNRNLFRNMISKQTHSIQWCCKVSVIIVLGLGMLRSFKEVHVPSHSSSKLFQFWFLQPSWTSVLGL